LKQENPSLNPINKIKHCDHLRTLNDENTGEKFCIDCGQVLIEHMVDFVSELHSSDYLGSRTGPKTTLKVHDRNLSTEIGKIDKDSSGKPIPFLMKNSIKRMRLWDSRSKTKSSSEKNLRLALFDIQNLQEKMGLSDAIIERASYFYRKASERNLIQGRRSRDILAACVYAACRDLQVNRTMAEISKTLHEKRSSIARSYRILFQNLHLDVPLVDSTTSIIKISNNLQIPEKTKRKALQIYDELKGKRVTGGKKPDSVAAVVVYMACIANSEEVSQEKISRVSGITKITIRNRYKEFQKFVPLF